MRRASTSGVDECSGVWSRDGEPDGAPDREFTQFIPNTPTRAILSGSYGMDVTAKWQLFFTSVTHRVTCCLYTQWRVCLMLCNNREVLLFINHKSFCLLLSRYFWYGVTPYKHGEI